MGICDMLQFLRVGKTCSGLAFVLLTQLIDSVEDDCTKYSKCQTFKRSVRIVVVAMIAVTVSKLLRKHRPNNKDKHQKATLQSQAKQMINSFQFTDGE